MLKPMTGGLTEGEWIAIHRMEDVQQLRAERTAMLDVIETMEGELTYKYTLYQRRVSFPKTAFALARFHETIEKNE